MGNIIIFLVVAYVLYRVVKSYKRFEKIYYREQFKNFTLTKEHLEQSELGLFVALTAKVAKADGRVDELEAELIGNMFNDISKIFPDPEHAKTLLKAIFQHEKELAFNLEQKAQELYRALKGDARKTHDMLGFWMNLAFVDGELSHNEEQMLRSLSKLLHVDETRFQSMLEQFKSVYKNTRVQSSIDDAYALLGMSRENSMDEIKKAYRKLVRQYHPDIIKAQGADEVYMKEATEKVQAINAAYEQIKKAID
ncbi:MAG: molecular chaperone DjlA [Sulfurimonas sp.]|nr:MAG: molecular chaperone DjlA [Sulfurimonas sp.]